MTGLSMDNVQNSQQEYKKAFGQFASLKTQRIAVLEPVAVELDYQEIVAGVVQTIDLTQDNILIKKSGAYLIIASPQVGKTEGNTNRWIDFWLRLNGKDIAKSNVRRILTNKNVKDVIPLNVVTDLNRGDTLNIMMSAETNDEGLGIEYIELDDKPSVPSIIVTIVQLD